MEAAQPTNTDGNMAGAFSTKLLKNGQSKSQDRRGSLRHDFRAFLIVQGTSSLLNCTIAQLKEVIHAYRNAEDFGRVLKRNPSIPLNKSDDWQMYTEDLQDLIDEFRDYQASTEVIQTGS